LAGEAHTFEAYPAKLPRRYRFRLLDYIEIGSFTGRAG
jgi:hypothetical protein